MRFFFKKRAPACLNKEVIVVYWQNPERDHLKIFFSFNLIHREDIYSKSEDWAHLRSHAVKSEWNTTDLRSELAERLRLHYEMNLYQGKYDPWGNIRLMHIMKYVMTNFNKNDNYERQNLYLNSLFSIFTPLSALIKFTITCIFYLFPTNSTTFGLSKTGTDQVLDPGGGTQLWVGYGCAARSFDHHPITKPEKTQICYLYQNHSFLGGPFLKPISAFYNVNWDA